MTLASAVIVEDNPLDARSIQHMLRKGASAPAQIACATSLTEAERLLGDEAPGVLLLDLFLPDADPGATLGFVARHGERVPIVVLTGTSDPGVLSEALRAHAQDFLVKWEFNANDLHRSINYAIERHRGAAEVRRARQEAEAANQAKSRFLATMSHEIRTPLSAVLGMAEVLATSPLSDGQRRQLELLRQAGQHLLALLDDMLDMGKIEAGRIVLERSPFEPGEFARGAACCWRGARRRRGSSSAARSAPRCPRG